MYIIILDYADQFNNVNERMFIQKKMRLLPEKLKLKKQFSEEIRKSKVPIAVDRPVTFLPNLLDIYTKHFSQRYSD